MNLIITKCTTTRSTPAFYVLPFSSIDTMRDPLAVQLMLADAGIPMILLAFPAMLMLLVPIIVVEGFLCKKWLALTTWDAMKSNAVSNLASTIIGVPVRMGNHARRRICEYGSDTAEPRDRKFA